MKVFSINAVPYGSTGNIMLAINKLMESRGHETISSSGFTWKKCDNKNHYIVGNIVTKSCHMILAKLTGYNGCFSHLSTRSLLREIEHFSPDVVHLHNIHGWFVNLPMLFSYIKRKNLAVVWTFHDCWPITGQCPHFTIVKCDKWKTGCYDCQQCRRYPDSYVDRACIMWKKKRQWFTGVESMTIVTPSQWLANLVKQSYLKNYPVKVINNGIDLSIFKPTNSDFRKRYGILEKQSVILGVSFEWDNRKGLDVFLDMAKVLDEGYCIILVGTNEVLEEKLPANIISIRRTHNPQELAEIYTASDVFANPTREDNFPTVNMEALACGTPVVTFRTGGSPEMLDDCCGSVVDYNDVDAFVQEICRVCKERPYSEQACIQKARKYDKNEKFMEYVRLFEGYE